MAKPSPVTSALRTTRPPPPSFFALIPTSPAETAPVTDTVTLLSADAESPAFSALIPSPSSPASTAPSTETLTAPVPSFFAMMPWRAPVTAAAAIEMPAPLESPLAWMPSELSPLPVTAPDAETATRPPPLLSAWIPWPEEPVTGPEAEILRSPVPAFCAQIPWRAPFTVPAMIVTLEPLESLVARIPSLPAPPPLTDPVDVMVTAPPPVFSALIPCPAVPDMIPAPAGCENSIPPVPEWVRANTAPEVVFADEPPRSSTTTLLAPLPLLTTLSVNVWQTSVPPLVSQPVVVIFVRLNFLELAVSYMAMAKMPSTALETAKFPAPTVPELAPVTSTTVALASSPPPRGLPSPLCATSMNVVPDTVPLMVSMSFVVEPVTSSLTVPPPVSSPTVWVAVDGLARLERSRTPATISLVSAKLPETVATPSAVTSRISMPETVARLTLDAPVTRSVSSSPPPKSTLPETAPPARVRTSSPPPKSTAPETAPPSKSRTSSPPPSVTDPAIVAPVPTETMASPSVSSTANLPATPTVAPLSSVRPTFVSVAPSILTAALEPPPVTVPASVTETLPVPSFLTKIACRPVPAETRAADTAVAPSPLRAR